MTMELWHCKSARSLRPLWALEEMQLDYTLHLLPFPPRLHQPEFLKTNPLGTVPYFIDGAVRMTESTAICHYLATQYRQGEYDLAPDRPEYGDFLNWLYHSDATLTFPQTLILRYSMMEPKERQQPQVVEDYRRWYLGRLRHLDAHILDRRFLCEDRFTIADIAVGYPLFLGEYLGLAEHYSAQTSAYLERLKSRPAFTKVEQLEG